MNSRHRLSYTQQEQNSCVIKENDFEASSEGQRLVIEAYSLACRVVLCVFLSRTRPQAHRAKAAKTARR